MALELKFQKDIFDSHQQPAEGRGAESPSRGNRSGGLNVTDERLLRQREQKDSNLSGLFEGTAGTGGDPRSGSSKVVDDSGGQSPYEFFRGKSFKAMNFQEGFAVNTHLGRERRTDFTTEGFQCLGDESGGGRQFTRATTMKQLEALSQTRKEVDLETPIQRINRLQVEVTDMMGFIKAFMDSRNVQLSDSAREESLAPAPTEDSLAPASGETPSSVRLKSSKTEEARRFFGADPSVLLRELDGLSSHLQSVVESDVYKSLTSCLPTPDTALVDLNERPTPLTTSTLNFVKSQLDATEAAMSKTLKGSGVKQEGSGAQQPPQTEAKGDTPFTYQLFSMPNVQDVVDSSRLLDLEHRLAGVEESLGLSRNGQLGLSFQDVSSALKDVTTRLMALTPSRLDGLSKRFEKLNGQIDDFLTRRQRATALQPKIAVNDDKVIGVNNDDQIVADVYSFCESTRPALAALPAVVRRLKALKMVHQEAASMTTRLETLESQQAEIAKLLDSSQTHFDSLKISVHQNISWARDVVDSLIQKDGSLGLQAS